MVRRSDVAPRETKQDKAIRFIATERVRVQSLGPGFIAARVAGDTGDYIVAWAGGRWECGCEASSKFGRSCSHIEAVKLIWRAILPALGEGGTHGS
jgi:hypothetical protein